jgi:uncharacterized protein YggU (UPF0235/DUF167 family)
MLIKVKVFPESREDAVEEVDSENYHVFVRASAQNNHANKVMIHLLTTHFGKGVKLMSGSTRQNKIVMVCE